MLPTIQHNDFKQTVWAYYNAHKRSMPWRQTHTPYFVLVSELMLQQTQVTRVKLKFPTFIKRFPTLDALANAPLADVITAWSGLGYNRRAKFLWQAARHIGLVYGGRVPHVHQALVTLPGVGPNTAGAILTYAFNQPAIFVETNIRTVFIRHFFAGSQQKVTDAQLHPLIQATLDTQNPREWYWALMDYGAHLKGTVGGQLNQVKGYQTQSKFQGSRRQIRGQVLKLLTKQPQSADNLNKAILDDRLQAVLLDLQREGFIAPHTNGWQLAP